MPSTNPAHSSQSESPPPAPTLRRFDSHRWTSPLTAEDRKQLHNEAHVIVSDMCEKGRWTLSVPVRDTDPDMVLSAVVRDAELLAAELDQLRAAIVKCHGFQHRGAGTACLCDVCETFRENAHV